MNLGKIWYVAKIAWCILLVALLVMEFRSIDEDRDRYSREEADRRMIDKSAWAEIFSQYHIFLEETKCRAAAYDRNRRCK